MGKYMGVDTDDPDIVRMIQNLKKSGMSAHAIYEHGRVGMPMEVIDKHFYASDPKPPKETDPEKKRLMQERMANARAARKPKAKEE